MTDSKQPRSRCPFRPPAPTPDKKAKSLINSLFQAQKDLLCTLPRANYRILIGQLRLGLRDLFYVNAPTVVKEVLNKDADNYPKSRQMYRALRPLVGDGIFISNGETWKRRRKMVTPSLANVRLGVAFPFMQGAVDDMVERLKALPNDAVVNLDAEMAHVTADIIFRAIFSQPLTQQVSRDVFEAFGLYQEALPQFDFMEILGMPRWFPRRSMRKAKQAGERIRGILHDKIEQRLNAQNPDQYQDILGVLMQSRDDQDKAFTLEELVDEVAVLFLAGHETSATALTWAVYLASQVPDIELRLVDEAKQVFNAGTVRYGDINRLKLTRNTFKEALRLYPPVSFITREAKEERTISRLHIRKNSMIVISPWLIQRHRRFWQQPDCFDPDRFDRPETKESEQRAYLPFGAGQRACPGASFAMLEGPLILANLFHHFKIRLADGVKVNPVCRLTTRPQHKILVHIEQRSN